MKQRRLKWTPHAPAVCWFIRTLFPLAHPRRMAGIPQQLFGEERSPWPAWANEPSRTCPTPWLVTVPWRARPKLGVVYEACGLRGMFAFAQPGVLTVMAGMDGDVDGEVVQKFIGNILEDVFDKHGVRGQMTWAMRCGTVVCHWAGLAKSLRHTPGWPSTLQAAEV